jgi:serine/threonine protein kinase
LLLLLLFLILFLRRRRQRDDHGDQVMTEKAVAHEDVDDSEHVDVQLSAPDEDILADESRRVEKNDYVDMPDASMVFSSPRDSVSAGMSPRREGSLLRNHSAVEQVWRIDAADLTLDRTLGEGAFGVVRRAEWRGRKVAVKQIKKTTLGNEQAVHDFEVEIGRMASLQPHENLVRLFGVTTFDNGDLGAVFEFCAGGSLKDALYGKEAHEWSEAQLMHFAHDAACGVAHLHANNLIHRDIAARNVLLAGKRDLVAKVADFGLARDLAEGDYVEQTTVDRVGPVRWMAPEQMDRLAYSKGSDVFSFGVLLFEIFACQAPWQGVANLAVASKVIAGERMHLPSSIPSKVRRLIRQCWQQEPNERPKMTSVQKSIQELISDDDD